MLNIAVSGLQAAEKRLAVSANNVANAATSRPSPSDRAGFTPERVVQTPVQGGGVRTQTQPVDPSSFVGFDSTSPTGLSEFPNVDLAAEGVEQIIAKVSYEASAALIRTQQELDETLLDLTA